MEPHEEPFIPKGRQQMEFQDSNPSGPRDGQYDYNSHTTKQTVGHALFEVALLTSNAMQLRTLLIQKQRDALWTLSLILVCISIIAQIILAGILIITGNSDIQKPEKQKTLEKYNNLVLAFTTLISMVNVIINAFMTTTNPITFFDKSTSVYLTNHTQKAYLSRN